MLKWINKKRNTKGFTLIELVVVIAILGILAAIAIPRLGGFSDAAEKRAVEADHRVLISAAQSYYADKGEWPTKGSDLDAYFEDGYGSTGETGTGFLKKSEKNNGSHAITAATESAAGTIVSKHSSGSTEGENQWTYTMD